MLVSMRVSWFTQSSEEMGHIFCCSCSVAKLCLTLCDLMDCSTLGSSSISWSLLKLMFIQSVMPSNHLILCHPLLFLPSISPSIRVFSNELAFARSSWSIEVSASASVPPTNIQDRFPLRLTCLIASQFKGLLRIFSSTIVQKHQFLGAQPSLWSNAHIFLAVPIFGLARPGSFPLRQEELGTVAFEGLMV